MREDSEADFLSASEISLLFDWLDELTLAEVVMLKEYYEANLKPKH